MERLLNYIYIYIYIYMYKNFDTMNKTDVNKTTNSTVKLFKPTFSSECDFTYIYLFQVKLEYKYL